MKVNEITISDEKKIKKVINVGAGVIVRRGENNELLVLLIQRSKDDHFPNFFEFPRGKCDKKPNEDIKECTIREVKEETGLDVKPIRLIDTFEYLAEGGTRKSICYNYLCIMKNPNQKVKLSKEHQNYTWIQSIGEAELFVLPDQKKTLAKVLNQKTSIVNYTKNDFTKNNQIEEYLQFLQSE